MLFTGPKSPMDYPTACGGNLREPGIHPSAEFRGRRVYFCTRACLRAFESDPDRFMTGEIEHPLEEE